MKGAPTVSNEYDARIRRAESLRSRPSPGVLAALRRVPRFTDAPGAPDDNPTALSAVRVATAPWRTAARGRRRKTLPAVLFLPAGMGVPENPLPDLRRRGRRQVTGVR